MKYHVTIETRDGKQFKSWGIFPIGQTKILDGIFNPETKQLSILFDSTTEQYTPVQVEEGSKVKTQMRKLDTYYKFNLPEEDVKFFLENYVENNFEFALAEDKKLIIDESIA